MQGSTERHQDLPGPIADRLRQFAQAFHAENMTHTSSFAGSILRGDVMTQEPRIVGPAPPPQIASRGTSTLGISAGLSGLMGAMSSMTGLDNIDGFMSSGPSGTGAGNGSSFVTRFLSSVRPAPSPASAPPSLDQQPPPSAAQAPLPMPPPPIRSIPAGLEQVLACFPVDHAAAHARSLTHRAAADPAARLLAHLGRVHHVGLHASHHREPGETLLPALTGAFGLARSLPLRAG